MRMLSIVCCFVFCASWLNASAQDIPSTIDVIESMVVDVVDSVCARAGTSAVSVSVLPHPDAGWLGGVMVRGRLAGGCFSAIADSATATVIASVSNVSTSYAVRPQSDSVDRIVTVRIDMRERSSGRTISTPARVRTDVCTRETAASLQSKQHNATYGDIPPAPTTFWDDVAQPLIFIAAAATTVLLLFTVRSQ